MGLNGAEVFVWETVSFLVRTDVADTGKDFDGSFLILRSAKVCAPGANSCSDGLLTLTLLMVAG